MNRQADKGTVAPESNPVNPDDLHVPLLTWENGTGFDPGFAGFEAQTPGLAPTQPGFDTGPRVWPGFGPRFAQPAEHPNPEHVLPGQDAIPKVNRVCRV